MRNIVICNLISFVLLYFMLDNVKCDDTDLCNFRTCGDCIRSTNCVWCSQDDVKYRRCQPQSAMNKGNITCKKEFITDPQPSQKVLPPTEFGKNLSGVPVQLKPQLIKMKLRPGIPMKFEMSFKPAADYPLDIYYLMDVSYTMKQRINDLKNQAKKIYDGLTAYTNNVRLGIGSFVEKPELPFVDTWQSSHAFKNLISLTHNVTQFMKTIDGIVDFGSNYDDPEAGLDALMQAMKCEPQIGWRPGARRIIVLCTDSTYHSAGDGKIVGAVKLHDMECHLNNNEYTEALTYDYPSVSQINKVAKEGGFIIIFAITKNNETNYLPKVEYTALAKQITGAKYADLRNRDGVVNLIKDAYKDAATSGQIEYYAPDFVQVNIDQDCYSETKRNCASSKIQPIVNISGTLVINSCPANKQLSQKVELFPVGLSDNRLVIEVELLCNCDCEKESGPLSPRCNNTGVLQCGICKCNPGRYGADCRCSGASTDYNDMKKCKFNEHDSAVCSGKGICRCGKCEECEPDYSGDFCEFHKNACPKPNNKICFGHGQCYRGSCHCDAGWTGDGCSCPDDKSTCYAPHSKKVCSGNGKCVCGACVCKKLEGKNETYFGEFCDSCDECAEKRCKELENYALCNYENVNNKTFCDDRNNGTTKDIAVSFVDKNEINGPSLYMAKLCKKEFDNGTYIVFKYQYDNHNLKITIQKELESPQQANVWIAVGSAIGLVLLIGILTVIIWKILVDLHDKREFQKFADEAEAAGYDVSLNPLYQEPAINFANPVYNRGH